MTNFILSADVFWVEKDSSVRVIKDSDSRIFTLEGIAAVIFKSIANKSEFSHSNADLSNRVLTDLLSLDLIQSA